MAAERHQAGDDGGFAKTNIAHNRHPTAGADAGPVEMTIDLLEKPLAPREDGVHGDAGHLKEQRFEGDVLGPIGRKTHWWVRRMKSSQAYYTYKNTPANSSRCNNLSFACVCVCERCVFCSPASMRWPLWRGCT